MFRSFASEMWQVFFLFDVWDKACKNGIIRFSKKLPTGQRHDSRARDCVAKTAKISGIPCAFHSNKKSKVQMIKCRTYKALEQSEFLHFILK